MAFPTDWNVDKYKTAHENEEQWELRRNFMERWKRNFPEDRLVCLAQVFSNIEYLGCRYPTEVMKLVAELSKEVAFGYRERMNKIQRTFESASDAAVDRAKGIKRSASDISYPSIASVTSKVYLLTQSDDETHENDRRPTLNVFGQLSFQQHKTSFSSSNPITGQQFQHGNFGQNKNTKFKASCNGLSQKEDNETTLATLNSLTETCYTQVEEQTYTTEGNSVISAHSVNIDEGHALVRHLPSPQLQGETDKPQMNAEVNKPKRPSRINFYDMEEADMALEGSSEPFNSMEVEQLVASSPTVDEEEAEKPSPQLQDETDKPQLETETNKPKRLGGAAKKRLNYLLKQGMPYEEARNQCLIPLQSNVAVKRPRTNDSSETSNPAKRERPDKRSFCDAAVGIKIGVCTKEYNAILTDNQLQLIESALIKAVVESIGKGFQPRFEMFAKKKGILALTCTDQGTHDWAFSLIPTLKPFKGADLRVVQGHEIPKKFVAVAWIPSEWKWLPQDVMHILGISNKGLNVKMWKALNTKQMPNGHIMTFSMDEDSVKALEACNFRPYMGICRITFKLKGQKQAQVGGTSTTASKLNSGASSGAGTSKVLSKPVEVAMSTRMPEGSEPVSEASSGAGTSAVLSRPDGVAALARLPEDSEPVPGTSSGARTSSVPLGPEGIVAPVRLPMRMEVVPVPGTSSGARTSAVPLGPGEIVAPVRLPMRMEVVSVPGTSTGTGTTTVLHRPVESAVRARLPEKAKPTPGTSSFTSASRPVRGKGLCRSKGEPKGVSHWLKPTPK